MRTLLAVLCLTFAAAPARAAEGASLLSDDDLARIIAARSGERVHCANLVTQQIETERRACAQASAPAAASCASLRQNEYDAMANVRLSAGGLLEGQEEFALGVMARSGCPGIFAYTRPTGEPLIVERSRWRLEGREDYSEYFNTLPMGRDGRMAMPPPEDSASGRDFINDLQAQLEAMLGINITPRTRCGLSTIELRRFRYRNGDISYSDKEDAFLGCIWRSRVEQ